MEPRITGGKIVIAENSRLTIKVYELEQRIRALNFDKNELIHRVKELVNEKDRLETANNQIHERDHYCAANIKEFEDFISNYIF
ncbi:27435_t:CDS:2, partial [Racocetra persica]